MYVLRVVLSHFYFFPQFAETVMDEETFSTDQKLLAVNLLFVCLHPVGHGGLHADPELGELDGASWTQAEGLDERKTKVRTD